MYDDPEHFSLWGIIDLEKNGAVVSRNLEGLFEQIKTEEELKKFPDKYNLVKSMIKTIANNSKTFKFNVDVHFEKAWQEYRELTSSGFPSKRTADLYILIKK